MEDMKLVWMVHAGDETIRIYRFDEDDYSIELEQQDYSVRGPFMAIAIELLTAFEKTAK